MKTRGLFKKRILLLVLILFLGGVMIFNCYKPLPKGLSYEGPIHKTDDIKMYSNLYYKNGGKTVFQEQIFNRINQMIKEADQFIVIDLFLLNGYIDDGVNYPKLSEQLTAALIQKKKANPNIQIAFITDEVNTTYGAHRSKELHDLTENGIQVVTTKLEPLRDSNPIYSSVWRTFFQWFGTEGKGWLPNPLSSKAPSVTLRSYLTLLNVKANHRKVILTDKTGMVSSANPHDQSGFHANMAFEVKGNVLNDLLKTEKAAAGYSGADSIPGSYKEEEKEQGDMTVRVLTEGKILKHVEKTIDQAEKGDTLWLGMFYLADRSLVNKLIDASNRGVAINMILDPNKNAFGKQKMGIPNQPVVKELTEKTHGKIRVRWYNVKMEQYHTKTMYLKHKQKGIIIAGSANFTKRNLADLNLETDLKIEGPVNKELMKEMDSYFSRLWNNEDGSYTLPQKAYQDTLTPLKRIVFTIQELLGFTTY
ncbi:phospholipase D family protein [Metabacillus sp. GX 13764]|uniref:phospholipase D family protein n=1 Tax=Metabacillus kandeliae TaxID=2900151 RepID=UPI001E3C16BD|nr:phospholipase D family protein [Metabacillus kandeliae]MCD7033527.1 phospholipase D family protein [Metabacillus kandeliae]